MSSNFFRMSAFALIVAVIAMNVSCKDDNDPVVEDPVLSVTVSGGATVTDIVFAANGSTATSGGSAVIPVFTVTTNQASWDVSANPNWVQISKSGSTFTLSAVQVDGTVAHPPSVVTVTAGAATAVTINVHQLAAGPSLAVTPLVPQGVSVEFNAAGTAATMNGAAFTPNFTVVTNVTTWDVAVTGGTWLTVVDKDIANKTFSLSAEANTSVTSPEPATVTVTAGEAPQITFTVTQLPATVPLVDFSLSDETIEFRQIGATHEIEVTLDPPTATVSPAEWISLNHNVVTVEDGVITAVGEGTTKVTCTIEGITKEVDVEVWITKPFMGPHVLSATEPYYLEIWKFDIGGPGISYRRDGNANEGIFGAAARALREGGGDTYFVQPFPEIDTRTQPTQIGGNQVDDWLLFTVEVHDAGNYKVELEFSVGWPTDGEMSFSVNDVKLGDNVILPPTGNWANYEFVEIGTFPFTEGKHKLKTQIEVRALNLVGLRFTHQP